MTNNNSKYLWNKIREEIKKTLETEKELVLFYNLNILNHNNFFQSLIHILAEKLKTDSFNEKNIKNIVNSISIFHNKLEQQFSQDLIHIIENDPVINKKCYIPFLYFKGFHALQSYRISHYLWKQKRKSIALYLQNQISTVFSVDIHPAAKIGKKVMLDHATGIVIGETSIIEDNVSIFHSVTLGSKHFIHGNRHPIIRKGVTIGAGAKIIGNIEIGKYSKIGAGSVVLHEVKPYSIVAGIPAKIIGYYKKNENILVDNNHNIINKKKFFLKFNDGGGI
ncbi:Serine acetyltransferase [Buchnera aphidicola (Thelaxes suberi)]|uniref:serine O-acetyltransferase n=1 Tax=Buchnera aphidicola TaxID=9 RepID=UPI00346388BD